MRSVAISSVVAALALAVYLAAANSGQETGPDMARTAELRTELLSNSTAPSPALVSDLEVPAAELIRVERMTPDASVATSKAASEGVGTAESSRAADAGEEAVRTPPAALERPAPELDVGPMPAPSIVTALPAPRELPVRQGRDVATPSDEAPSAGDTGDRDPEPSVRPPTRRGPVTIRGGGSIYDDCAAHTHPRSIGATPPRGGAMVNNRIPTRGGTGFPIGGIRGR